MSNTDVLWEAAPEWANYLAKDYDGWYFWYEKEPYEGKSGKGFYAGNGRFNIAFENLNSCFVGNETQTIEKRKSN